jgi:hypothetical protein
MTITYGIVLRMLGTLVAGVGHLGVMKCTSRAYVYAAHPQGLSMPSRHKVFLFVNHVVTDSHFG